MQIKSFMTTFGKNATMASNGFVYTKPLLRCKMLVGKSQTLELHRSDAGLAFLQNALSALRRSAQPSRYRDDHRVWDSSQQVNEHGEILISCVNLGLCTYKGPACCGCIRNRVVPRSIACSCFALLLNCQIVLQLLYWVYQNFFGRMPL